MKSIWSPLLRDWLLGALADRPRAGFGEFLKEGSACDPQDMGPWLAKASRFARSEPLGLSPEDCCRAAGLVEGWNPERLGVLEALRLALLTGRQDLEGEAFAAGFLGLFPFADEGELAALYKFLALVPEGERFVWQAGEGLRTNVTSVFDAVACDSPYPAIHLPEVAWRSMCIKALFLGSPLWRVFGLDRRLDPELARMALDLVEERRSAGRAIMSNLWLLLGEHGGERARHSLNVEWETLDAGTRGPVALALGRRGDQETLKKLEGSASDMSYVQMALEGRFDPTHWRAFEE